MLQLNFSSAEELVFYDTAIQRLLPQHMFSIFEQWRLSKRVPFLRDIGKRAVLDFLNALTDRDIAVLEDYFGDKILVEKLNYDVVLNLKVPLDKACLCEELCKTEGFSYLSTWRDDEHLYLSFWR